MTTTSDGPRQEHRLHFSVSNWIALLAILGGPAVGHFVFSLQTGWKVEQVATEVSSVKETLREEVKTIHAASARRDDGAMEMRSMTAKLSTMVDVLAAAISDGKEERAEIRQELRSINQGLLDIRKSAMEDRQQ